MPAVTTRGLASALAIPVLALGFVACSPSDKESNQDEIPTLTAEQAVLASYESLGSESYTMEMTITMNDLDFITSTTVVDGESSHTTQDLHMSAILEMMDDPELEDPALAEVLKSMFSDIRSETIVVDGVIYMQLSGGALDAADRFGPDAWFTTNLSETGLSEIYEQFGGLDLTAQTELLLMELTNLEQTGDNTYTGTLKADSQVAKSMAGAANPLEDPAAQGGFDGSEATVVVTVDDNGLLQGVDMTVPEADGVTLRMVSEIVNVGGGVTITAPDSDNLHTLEELFNTTG